MLNLVRVHSLLVLFNMRVVTIVPELGGEVPPGTPVLPAWGSDGC
jgi:hypothetical protein